MLLFIAFVFSSCSNERTEQNFADSLSTIKQEKAVEVNDLKKEIDSLKEHLDSLKTITADTIK